MTPPPNLAAYFYQPHKLPEESSMHRQLSTLFVVLMFMLLLPALPTQQAQAVSPDIVISQVYGGGGNSGATWRNDFVELFNRGTSAVNVAGWSVQYAASTGVNWSKTDLAGTIQPGQ